MNLRVLISGDAIRDPLHVAFAHDENGHQSFNPSVLIADERSDKRLSAQILGMNPRPDRPRRCLDVWPRVARQLHTGPELGRALRRAKHLPQCVPSREHGGSSGIGQALALVTLRASAIAPTLDSRNLRALVRGGGLEGGTGLGSLGFHRRTPYLA